MDTRVREIRAERGWTVRRLAKESGVDKNTISKVERGRRNPNPITMHKLAEALGVEVRELFPLGQVPLPLEWALASPDETFRRGIEGTPTGDLQDLIVDFTAGHRPRILDDEEGEELSGAERYRRAVSFARALIVRDELLARGEEPPENRVLALRRYMNALELSEDPALGRYRAEGIFSPDQVAAWLEEDEQHNERIKEVLSKLSREDRTALMAAPGMRKLSAAYAESQEVRDAAKPEAS